MRRVYPLFTAAWLIGAMGCQDLNQPLPAGTVDPATFDTPDGALSLYRGALLRARDGAWSYASISGEFTDEISSSKAVDVGALGRIAGTVPVSVDARNFEETREDINFSTNYALYTGLQAMRTNIDQALGLLKKFSAETPRSLQAELYALKGMSLIFLGEFYCSGVPLSTVDFEGDFTYAPGSSTTELFESAIHLFDSALTLGADSARLKQFAQLGAARALVNLGRWEEAAQRANTIEAGFSYWLPLETKNELYYNSVSDMEGRNGLAFRTSNDPRSRSFVAGIYLTRPYYWPSKYTPAQGGSNRLILASYIEAVLIQAEAELQQKNSHWLERLNALRTDNTYTVTGIDTLWNAGTGGVAGLPPLRDPASRPLPPGQSSFDAQVNLLFSERAFWLFLDGHRQGDLRRLIRQYQRDAESVYPSGAYGLMGETFLTGYGHDVTAPVPYAEKLLNPVYHGCIHRGA